MRTTDRLFLDFSIEKLRQFTDRIETCLTALADHQIWARGGENENAVGNLALHLCGNVRQWIVSGVGGRADVRRRDEEFAARGGLSGVELMARLREVVEEASSVIAGLTEERLTQPLTIQGYEVTVFEAVYHVVEHFSMHTGQIIFASKILTGADFGFYRHLAGSGAAQGENVP